MISAICFVNLGDLFCSSRRFVLLISAINFVHQGGRVSAVEAGAQAAAAEAELRSVTAEARDGDRPIHSANSLGEFISAICFVHLGDLFCSSGARDGGGASRDRSRGPRGRCFVNLGDLFC